MFRRRRRSVRSATWSRNFRVKYREAWVAILVSAAIIASSGLILGGLIIVAGREAPLRLMPSETGTADSAIVGSGLNLRGLGDVNLIENPSFEPYLERTAMAVTAAYMDDDGYGVWTPLVDDGEEELPDKRYLGSRYRVLRQNESGQMRTINQGLISDYRTSLPLKEQITQLSDHGDQLFTMTNDLYVSDEASTRQMVGVGEGGLILWYDGEQFQPYTLNVNNGELFEGYEPAISFRGPSLIDIERVGDYYYLLASNGLIYSTRITEATGWTRLEDSEPIRTPSSINRQEWVDLFAVGDVLFAMNAAGVYLQISQGSIRQFDLAESILNPFESSSNPTKIVLEGVFISEIQIRAADAMGQTIILATSSSVILLDLEAEDDGFYTIIDGQASVPKDSQSALMSPYWEGITVIDEATAIVNTFMFDCMIVKDTKVWAEQEPGLTNSDASFQSSQSPDGEPGEVSYAPSRPGDRFSMSLIGSSDILEINSQIYPIGIIPVDQNAWYYVCANGDMILFDGDEKRIRQHFSLSLDTEYAIAGAWLLPGEGIVLSDYTSDYYKVPLGTALLFEEGSDILTSRVPTNGDVLIIESSDQVNLVEEMPSDWHFDDGLVMSSHPEDKTDPLAKSGSQFLRFEQSGTLKQIIVDPQQTSSVMSARSIYSLKFLAKEVGVGGDLIVRITGPFPAQILHFSNFDQNWRSFEEHFIIPKRINSEAAIEISFEWLGDSSLDIDDIFLGETIRGDSIYDVAAKEELLTAEASLLRFADVTIGQKDIPNHAWLDYQDISLYPIKDGRDRVSSLEAALRLARSSQSEPWLVFDSFAQMEDAKSVMNYLAAPVSEYYGDKRLTNGTAMPWTGQFSRIIIEITDSAAIYRTDSERAAFVDMVIEGLQSSSHYQTVKHQIVLVDSMNYNEGLMQSKADYHASSLDIELGSGLSFPEAVEKAYNELAVNSPRQINRPGRNTANLINQFSFSTAEGYAPEALSAAAYGWSVMTHLTQTSGAVMLDVDYNEADQSINDLKLKVARLLAKITDSKPVDMLIVDPDAEITKVTTNEASKAENHSLYSFAFRQEDRLIIVILNVGTEAESFELDLDLNSDQLKMQVYDKAADLQTSESYRGDYRRILLPAGSLAVVYEEVEID